ncbi:MAG: ligase-associated DNA damage response exonuclease [Acidobacteriota bacterium]
MEEPNQARAGAPGEAAVGRPDEAADGASAEAGGERPELSFGLGAESELLTLTPEGLYCPPADLYIDPWRPVHRAVVTHAHADHARPGSGGYVVSESSQGLMRRRLGAEAVLEPLPFGAEQRFGSVRLSLHPAGHVLGSAQVRLEANGVVVVISGDYKREADRSCEPFEVVPCDVFLTEATFALPVFSWEPTEATARRVLAWWRENAAAGRTSLLLAYALGKAQRLLAELRALERAGEELPASREVVTHGAVEGLTAIYRQGGIEMLPTVSVAQVEKGSEGFAGRLVVAPPSAFGSPWARRFRPLRSGFASGWMRLRGNRRRRGYDAGFVLSDHADWRGLLSTVAETGARRVLTTHGYSEVLARALRHRGLDATALRAPGLRAEGAATEGAGVEIGAGGGGSASGAAE